ncbi:YjdJ family protein [Virgibacillus xinjiangensis]|uniref:YjdJ family protein n=1 Tax=Virgibacillus xinjiangensis TaxID=393090 RepID=A0ABV7CZ64_9BACI
MKYVIQYLLAFGVLIFSTFAAWYEGSAIRFDSYEWKYSAYFSRMFNGEITNKTDISQLDHFIYAAKFSPAFPILMVISLSYILMISSYLLLRKNTKSLIVSHLILSVLYLLLGVLTSNSPTAGGTYFTIVLLTIGILNVFLSLLFFLKVKKGTKRYLRHAT